MTFLDRATVPGLPDFYTHRARQDPAPRRVELQQDRELEGEELLGCILNRLSHGGRLAQALSDEIGVSYSAIDYWLRIARKRGLVERETVRMPLSNKPLFRYQLIESGDRRAAI